MFETAIMFETVMPMWNYLFIFRYTGVNDKCEKI